MDKYMNFETFSWGKRQFERVKSSFKDLSFNAIDKCHIGSSKDTFLEIIFF